jgi:hypothetical protein
MECPARGYVCVQSRGSIAHFHPSSSDPSSLYPPRLTRSSSLLRGSLVVAVVILVVVLAIVLIVVLAIVLIVVLATVPAIVLAIVLAVTLAVILLQEILPPSLLVRVKSNQIASQDHVTDAVRSVNLLRLVPGCVLIASIVGRDFVFRHH